MNLPSNVRKIAFLADYIPRKCGIATFTADLREAIAAQYPDLQSSIVAMTDDAEGYDDPPEVRFADPNYYKDKFGAEGRPVLLTFGLLSPNKGIEHVLNALPAIVREFPKVVYIVLGATHPNLARDHGETYRLSLERLAKKNGVEKNVIFFNRFV